MIYSSLRILIFESWLLMKKILKEAFLWVGSLSLAVTFALIITIFVIQPTKVLGISMEPTLQDGQFIFVSKLSHTFNSEPDYDDIVILDSRVNYPRTFKDDILDHPILLKLFGEDKKQVFFIKRVIGKAGDEIKFIDHKVYRNGDELDEPYLHEMMEYTSDKVFVVPEGHVFVLGDNRNHSTDSRDIGMVPIDHILGKKL